MAVWTDYTARSYSCVGSWYASRDVTVPLLLGSRKLGDFGGAPESPGLRRNTSSGGGSRAGSSRAHSRSAGSAGFGSAGFDAPPDAEPATMLPAVNTSGGGSEGGGAEGAEGGPEASFSMSMTDKLAEQASNIIRIIHAALQNNRRLYGQTLKDVAGVFAAFDKDGSGTLDLPEVEMALNRLGCGLTGDQVEQLMTVLDKGGNGTLELSEFVGALETYASGDKRKQLTPAQQARRRFEAAQEAAQIAAAERQAAAARAAREKAVKAGVAARADAEARLTARQKAREEAEAVRATEQLVKQAKEARKAAVREKRRLAERQRRLDVDAVRVAAKRAENAAERAENVALWAEGKLKRDAQLAVAIEHAKRQQQAHDAATKAARRRQSCQLQMHRMVRQEEQHEWEEERQSAWNSTAEARARGANRALTAQLERGVRIAEEQAEAAAFQVASTRSVVKVRVH